VGKKRLALGHFAIRLGRFIQSLAIVPMSPNDLVEFSRRSYSQAQRIEDWGRDALMADGLYPGEEAMLSRIPQRSGPLLLLGGGGGRDAIGLARHGFTVTAVDFVPELLECAKKNATRHGLSIQVLTQEISLLDTPVAAYDIVWFSQRLYSTVPTKQRRITLLQRVGRALSPGGLAVCQFHWDINANRSPQKMRTLRRLVRMTFGLHQIEPGDQLWQQREYLHAFHDEELLKAEFAAGGFEILHLEFFPAYMSGSAILRKRNTV